MTRFCFGQSVQFGGFVNLGVGPVDMADNSVDPWQQELNIFSSPKITGIPSSDIVQNTLEN